MIILHTVVCSKRKKMLFFLLAILCSQGSRCKSATSCCCSPLLAHVGRWCCSSNSFLDHGCLQQPPTVAPRRMLTCGSGAAPASSFALEHGASSTASILFFPLPSAEHNSGELVDQRVLLSLMLLLFTIRVAVEHQWQVE